MEEQELKIRDSFTIDAPKQDVWEVFMEVEKLASCVPGCKDMTALSDTEYEAYMEVQTKFMKITFKANGQLKDFVEGEELNVEMTGKPMKLAGLFKTKLKVRLNELATEKTEVVYDMDLQMSGRLASLGDVMMKGTVVKSSREFAENVQRLFAS
jgi:carbon monoxide dehydrogenase subunit G